jgi:pyridoxal phosphate enzyme (YggS family)
MKERLEKIQSQIREACLAAGRSEHGVKLIAVSKTKSAEMIRAFANLGVMDFGENYVQEALPKVEALQDLGLHWHFIGGLQSNKAKFIPGRFSLLHTVDSISLAEKVNKAAMNAGLVQDCLLEVNISGEGSKSGLELGGLLPLLERCAQLGALHVRGLMCIPAAGLGRAPFAHLRGLLEEANRMAVYPRALTELSMGMSGDFKEAILEGSTMVRIGTALFGERS